MDLRSWTWIHLAIAIAGYWALVITAWLLYTTRPAQQARARAEATTEVFPGQRPDEQVVVLSGTINLTRVLTALLGPPILLVVVSWAC